MVKLISIEHATAAGKKYKAIFRTEHGIKTVNFGAKGMDDYTITHDIAQRSRYRQRHQKDLSTEDPMRAGYLSYYILWGNSTNIHENIAQYKRKFNL
jgi:hypothetical protein